MPPSVIRAWSPHVALYNLYGVTEATVRCHDVEASCTVANHAVHQHTPSPFYALGVSALLPTRPQQLATCNRHLVYANRHQNGGQPRQPGRRRRGRGPAAAVRADGHAVRQQRTKCRGVCATTGPDMVPNGRPRPLRGGRRPRLHLQARCAGQSAWAACGARRGGRCSACETARFPGACPAAVCLQNVRLQKHLQTMHSFQDGHALSSSLQ